MHTIFGRIKQQPVFNRCAFIKMKSVCGVYNFCTVFSCFSASKSAYYTTNGRVAMNNSIFIFIYDFFYLLVCRNNTLNFEKTAGYRNIKRFNVTLQKFISIFIDSFLACYASLIEICWLRVPRSLMKVRYLYYHY